MSPSTTSDQIGKGEKRSASEGSSQDGSKQKVRKVVVGQNHDNSTNREDGEGLKQQKLVVEPPTTTTKEEEGTEKKKEEQEVIVIDDEDEGKSNDKGNGTNGDHDDKKDSTGDEDNKKKDDGEVLATREEGEKDQGKNFEPGEKPDLNLSKQDFERKHGQFSLSPFLTCIFLTCATDDFFGEYYRNSRNWSCLLPLSTQSEFLHLSNLEYCFVQSSLSRGVVILGGNQ